MAGRRNRDSAMDRKKKVKMKGIRTPLLFVFILGFIHGKRNLIMKSGENELISPYTIRKKKDFHEYQAKLYQVTAWCLETVKLEKLHAVENLCEVERLLTQYQNNEITETANITQQRAKDAGKRRKEELERQRTEFLAKISDAEDAMAASEMETKEMVISCKRRMEGKIAVYMEGAGFIEGVEHEFPEDPFVIETYRNYVDKLTVYETVSERG